MEPLGIDNFKRQQAALQRLTSQLSPDAQRTFDAAQEYIQQLNASREGLRNVGILRTGRSASGDYAEWLAAEFLGLELASSAVQKDYDALDPSGHRYQIKSRIVTSLSEHTSFDFRTLDMEQSAFDYLVGVFFSHDLDVLGIIRVPIAIVRDLSVRNSGSVRFRWTSRSSLDTRIERLIWLPEFERGRGTEL